MSCESDNTQCCCASPKTTHDSGVTRRVALGGVGVGAAAVTLTACSSSENSAESSSGNNGSAIDPKGPSEPTDVAAASDVPVGGALKATAGELTVMLTQPTDGQFKAFSSICTHQGCVLNVQGKNLTCPCHASQFSEEDGSVQGGPAPEPLTEFPVEVKDGRVIVSPAA